MVEIKTRRIINNQDDCKDDEEWIEKGGQNYDEKETRKRKGDKDKNDEEKSKEWKRKRKDAGDKYR